MSMYFRFGECVLVGYSDQTHILHGIWLLFKASRMECVRVLCECAKCMRMRVASHRFGVL